VRERERERAIDASGEVWDKDVDTAILLFHPLSSWRGESSMIPRAAAVPAAVTPLLLLLLLL